MMAGFEIALAIGLVVGFALGYGTRAPKALGLDVPPTVVARADEVIE